MAYIHWITDQEIHDAAHGYPYARRVDREQDKQQLAAILTEVISRLEGVERNQAELVDNLSQVVSVVDRSLQLPSDDRERKRKLKIWRKRRRKHG